MNSLRTPQIANQKPCTLWQRMWRNIWLKIRNTAQQLKLPQVLPCLLFLTVFSTHQAFAVPSGSILHPRNNQTYNSNLVLFFNVSDTANLSAVGLQFGDNGNNVTFCNGNCNNRYRGFRSGVNPINFGLNPGSNTIRLWANTPDNIIDTATFNWQPREVTGISSQRALGQITLNWSALSGYRRYNLYIASEQGVTPQNFSSLNGGRAFRALSNTSQVVPNLENDISYYVRITGIDASGESAFSREIAIPALNNALPVAVNDSFTINEDQTLRNTVMSNDFDPDNQGGNTPQQTLVASVIEPPSNGTVTLQSSGTFVYTPRANFNGSDSFIYQIKDDLEGIAEANVIITIRAVNDAPVAVNDSYNVNEDNQLIVPASGLLSNDTDIDNDTLSVNPVARVAPQFGQLAIASNGGFTYTPDNNFSGTDTFVYALNDGSVNPLPTAQVTINVAAVNDPPAAQNDNFVSDEDSTVQGNVLNNDVDADIGNGDKTAELAVSQLTSPTNGTLNLNAQGEFTYVPNSNFFGNDGFNYRITDSAGATSDAQVSFTINSVNDTPTAEDDIYSINEDETLSVPASTGILANDSDPDLDDSLSFSELSNSPLHGTVNIAADGSFNYTPLANFNGLDSFTYIAKDDAGATATGTVEITVFPIPDAPIIENESAEAISGEAVEIDVLSNDINLDGENSELTLISASALNGTVAISQSGKSIAYTANSEFEGTDTISYSVQHTPQNTDTGEKGLISSGTVTVTVLLPNDPPIANEDSISLEEDATATINVLGNDTDPDNDPLTVIEAIASSGTVTINADNTLEYAPEANFHGNVTINYSIKDSRDHVASSLVNITITPVNDAPVVNDDDATTLEDTAVTINILSNDIDVDNDSLTITSLVATNGNAETTSDQQVIYTPTENFNGEGTINYIVSDGQGGIASGKVTITITPVNDPPVANADTESTIENVAITISPLSNDSDVENDPLSIGSATVDIGSVSLSGNTQIIYTPPSVYQGTAQINYSAIDGNGGTAGGIITVTVIASNQSPSVTADSYVINSINALVSVPASVGVLENDSDPEGVTLTASVLSSPANASSFTLNSDGSFNYQHDNSNNFSDSFSYQASDGVNVSSTSVSLTIHKPNHVPRICNVPPTQATLNKAYSYTIEAQDGDEDSLTYSASNLPAWLSINTATGLISGTPTGSDSSASGIVLKATDNINTSKDYTFSINLQNEFGSSNAATVNIGAPDDKVEAIALDNYGRIVAVGQSNEDFAVVRLLPDGTLDTSFSTDGIQVIDFGSTDYAYGVAIDKENNIIVIGQTNDSTNGDTEIGIAKLLSDGNLDTSFGGGDGKFEVDIGANTPDYAHDVVIHDNTDITVVGHYFNGSDKDIIAIQLMASGTLDTTFGTNGKLIYSSANDQLAHSVIKDEEDRLYIGGTHHNGTDDDFLIARIDLDSDSNGVEDGAWDTSFDTDGIFTHDAESTEQGKDISFDADGNLVIVGRHNNNFGIYNFTTAPALNTAGFNNPNGFLVHDITGSALDVATQVIRDNNSNLYVFGKADDDIGIIKVKADGTLDSNFAGSGELIVPITSSGTTNVSGMLNGNGQLLYADSDTTNNEMLFFQKDDISNTSFPTCDIASTTRDGAATNTTDVIVKVVEGAISEFYAVGYGKPNATDPEDLLIFKLSSNNSTVSEFGKAGYLRYKAGASFITKSAVTTSSQDLIVTGYYNSNQIRTLKFNVSGNLDGSFAASGIQDFGGTHDAVAFGSEIDASDSIIIASTIFDSTPIVRLFKLDSAGNLDASFGSSGIADYTGATGKDMAVTPDGSMYIAGIQDGSNYPAIIKFLANGSIDTSFGASGIMTFMTTNMESITALTDNTIVFLMNDGGPVLKKINSSGDIVNNFGTSGVLNLSPYLISTNNSIDSDSNNKIYIQLDNASADPVLLKIDSNGKWDKAFLNAGQATLTSEISGWANIKGFAFEDTNQFAIFGETGGDFALAHMDTNGTMINGESALYFDFGFGEHGYAIDLDRKGRIVVAGSSYDPDNFDDDQAIARFLTSGAVDTSFDGSDGIHIEAGTDTELFTGLSINTQSQATLSGVDAEDTVVGLLQPNSTTVEGEFNSATYLVNSSASNDTSITHYVDDQGIIWLAGSKDNKGRIETIEKGGVLQGMFAESPGYVNYELDLLADSKLTGLIGTSDGMFVAVGEIRGSAEFDAIIVKFDKSGLLDTSFDSDGIVYIGVDDNLDNSLNDVTLDATGNILAVGEKNHDMYMLRMSNSGVLINSHVVSNSDDELAVAVELDKFGAIFVAGHSDHGFSLYRFKSDWTQLTVFPTREVGEALKARDIVIDSIGNVYLTGSAQIEQEWDIFVLKYPSAVGSY